MAVTGKSHLFFRNVVKEVTKLPATKVIEKYIKVHYNRFADNDGLCPFHGDTAFGNFKINDKKGIFKCFTCGAYGDAIQFVKDFLRDPQNPISAKLEFKQAVLKIAVDQKIITEAQAESFWGGKLSDTHIQAITDDMNTKEKVNGITKIATPSIRHLAYQLFLMGVSLSDEHRAYLKNRGLSDEEINEKRFFTFPLPTREFCDELHNRCLRNQITPNIFKRVPGFHTHESLATGDIQPKTGEKEYLYTFAKQKGIGIPVKDAAGNIIGIQIRKDNPGEKKKRYTWFSSSYAGYDDNEFIFGTPAGAPTHVVYPKENRFPGVVFVTEGFFKAEEVAKTFGAVCISVSGVGNYRSIPEDLKSVELHTKAKTTHVYVSYDADMCKNVQVYHHAKNLAGLIKENFPEVELYMSLWNEKDGKGIDDLIQNQKANTLRKVEFALFSTLYDEMVERLEKEYEIINRVPKEVVEDTFYRHIFPKVYVS